MCCKWVWCKRMDAVALLLHPLAVVNQMGTNNISNSANTVLHFLYNTVLESRLYSYTGDDCNTVPSFLLTCHSKETGPQEKLKFLVRNQDVYYFQYTSPVVLQAGRCVMPRQGYQITVVGSGKHISDALNKTCSGLF